MRKIQTITHLVLELARILFVLAQHLFLPGRVSCHVFLALRAKLPCVLGLQDTFCLPFFDAEINQPSTTPTKDDGCGYFEVLIYAPNVLQRQR